MISEGFYWIIPPKINAWVIAVFDKGKWLLITSGETVQPRRIGTRIAIPAWPKGMK